MSEMEAGRELDALVAERVMGWALAPDTNPPNRVWPLRTARVWRTPDSNLPHALPAYSSDIAAAWQVVEKMLQTVFAVEVRANHESGWVCEVEFSDGDRITKLGDDAPLAICNAALAAVPSPESTPTVRAALDDDQGETT